MFFKMWVFLVITGCGKKKRNVKFLIFCAEVVVCGRLLIVSVSLMVVCSRLLLACGGLWSLSVLVASFDNSEGDLFY